MVADDNAITALKRLGDMVHRASKLRQRWDAYSGKEFIQKAKDEFQAYHQDSDYALEELLRITKLKPKRLSCFKSDDDLLVEKLTRNVQPKDQKEQIAYYCAELMVAENFLAWIFSEADSSIELKQSWATDALDDIEIFSYKLVKLISNHLGMQWRYMNVRPSSIWASKYRKVLQDFNSEGLRNWRLAAPLIRAALETSFLEPLLYGKSLTVTNKYIPWEELHGRLKGLSFGDYLSQLDKLFYIYRWASVHIHWGKRYSVGACWFIANYLARLKIDEILREWCGNNPNKHRDLLQRLERDGYIRLKRQGPSNSSS